MTNSHSQRGFRLAEGEVQELNATLTLLRAHAQLVRRWLQRNEVSDAEPALGHLAEIDTLIMRLVEQLDRHHVLDIADDAGNGQRHN